MRLWKKDLIAVIAGLLLLGGLVAWFLSPRFVQFGGGPSLRSNMHVLQLALEDFSRKAAGHYPVDINTTVEEAIGTSSGSSEGLFSISGAKGSDPVTHKDIGSTGPILLPDAFHNPYNRSRPALATSLLDPPRW